MKDVSMHISLLILLKSKIYISPHVMLTLNFTVLGKLHFHPHNFAMLFANGFGKKQIVELYC